MLIALIVLLILTSAFLLVNAFFLLFTIYLFGLVLDSSKRDGN